MMHAKTTLTLPTGQNRAVTATMYEGWNRHTYESTLSLPPWDTPLPPIQWAEAIRAINDELSSIRAHISRGESVGGCGAGGWDVEGDQSVVCDRDGVRGVVVDSWVQVGKVDGGGTESV